MPWFACLFVVEDQRNKGIARLLLEYGLNEAKMKGFGQLYLYTDLENFYERMGWKHFCNGYNVANMKVKIYTKEQLKNCITIQDR
jgi:N-acetylglutamate synthase-like GNAT family acetyltransferase